jgi:hypothetical protein
VNADTFEWKGGGAKTELERLEIICNRWLVKNLPPGSDQAVDGTTIFPGARWRFEKEFLIPRRVLNEKKTDPKELVAVVAGCVDYAFSFGPLEPHQTRFILYIGKPNDFSSESLAPIVIGSGNLTPKDLRIVRAARLRAFGVT